MPSNFDLTFAIDDLRVDLTLKDSVGRQLAQRSLDFGAPPLASRLEQLGDLRNWLRRNHDTPETQAAALAETGVVIAREVLGDEIFDALARSNSARSLRLIFRGPAGGLSAALARVPWELARAEGDQATLLDRNLRVSIGGEEAEPAAEALALTPGEPLRVLMVFAAARASKPLAAREERWRLRALFEREVFPERNVVVDFLTHGVTRERLAEQILAHGGYHAIHWSGHGSRNGLELVKADGSDDLLSGEDLITLLVEAGGNLPRLVVLSACESGAVSAPTSFDAMLDAARPGAAWDKPAQRDALTAQPGFSGVARALRASGVPSVVAMRYSVSDGYATDLAEAFYRRLLADAHPKTVAEALATARRALVSSGGSAPSDHATPVLFGVGDPGVRPCEAASPQHGARRDNRRLRAAELDAETTHAQFVGRVWELAALERDFFGIAARSAIRPVAQIVGIGGMGKTALAAEALDLWGRPFDHVLIFQSKPNELKFEEWLRTIDGALRDASHVYRERIRTHPREAIWLRPEPENAFVGERRAALMIDNLVAALSREAILLTLDNFETCLKDNPGPGGPEAGWPCKDAAWTSCLTRLAAELKSARSRVLITSRRAVAGLDGAHLARLGTLPAGEAALYLRAHPQLRRLAWGAHAERARAIRILKVSRFHPLLMDRLARLAAPGLETQLEEALTALERRDDLSRLPTLFAAAPGANPAGEIAYLEDALRASVDRLIADVSPDARRLLWMIALANEPEAEGLLRLVWSGEGPETGPLRALKAALDDPAAPAGLRDILTADADIREKLATLPPPPERGDPTSALRALEAIGLAEAGRSREDDDNPDWSCHEIVRERIEAWMRARAEDRGELSADSVRLAYAEGLIADFEALRSLNMDAACRAGARAIVYCVQARAWGRLAEFGLAVVANLVDPGQLERLLAPLVEAAEAAPPGKEKGACLLIVADALHGAARPRDSLRWYERAAEAFGAQADPDSKRGLAAVLGNWALAHRDLGDVPRSSELHRDSAKVKREAGAPEIDALGSELEALRNAVMQGQAATVLPEIEARLGLVKNWRAATQRGEPPPQAPDRSTLDHVFIVALDIARQAQIALERWGDALSSTEAIITVKNELGRSRYDVARDQFNRAGVLIRLGRFDEARQDLDACDAAFEDDLSRRSKVIGLRADYYDEVGDVEQAIQQQRRALAIHGMLDAPGERAISHNNLVAYLEKRGEFEDRDEARRHRLAALVYRRAADLGADLRTDFRNYVVVFLRAARSGVAAEFPRLADLLEDPAFADMRGWLEGRGEDVAALQVKIDAFVDAARQIAQSIIDEDKGDDAPGGATS